jgi:hypothetical protein
MVDKEAAEQNAEELCRLIDETLLEAPPRVPDIFFENLRTRAVARKLQWEPEIILEHWWWLARLGVIALPGASAQIPQAQVPQVLLTRRGLKLLERGE